MPTTKSKHPQHRLKYLGNVIKVPADKINAVLSGEINRIILPEGTDFSFNNIYAYKQGSKSSEQHIGVFAVIAATRCILPQAGQYLWID